VWLWNSIGTFYEARPRVSSGRSTFKRDPDQLASGSHAGLSEQLLDRGLDGRFGYTNLRSDLLVGQAIPHATKNCLLPISEASRPARFKVRIPLGKESDHLLIHPCLPARNQPYGLQEPACRLGRQENPSRSAFQYQGGPCGVKFPGDDQTFSRTVNLLKPRKKFIGDTNVHQDHVYPWALQALQRFGGSCEFCDQFEVVFR